MPSKKPPREHCTFVRRFRVADERAKYVGSVSRYHAHVGEGQLWLSENLSIPLTAIRGKEIVKRGWLMPRRALRIEFNHPETHVRDVVHLCDLNWLGLYRRESLEALSFAIDKARPESDPVKARASIPPIAKRRGVFKAFATLLGNALLSRERLAMRYYAELSESLDLDDVSFETADEARLYIARESIGRGAPLDPEELVESERKQILAGRALAMWTLFWLVLLPLWVTARWAISAVSTLSIPTVLGLFIGYCAVASLGVFVASLLDRPFVWLLSRAIGISITYHSRRYW